MSYILVIELESTGETTCNIKGLPGPVVSNLENYFKAHNINCKNERICFEVDTEGIYVLNILGSPGFGYRVATQSMAIDTTTIGGRSVKIQKNIWTLSKID
ncbi:unnamed protein product [Pieris brassicae]|uniref:Uncharacterized protein n=1 Tax=Pieris brassicae TaxID=7116 RepID=A0A9P0TE95_PIEBR|nr:unnamed protein product [Pieris brassicae]